MTSRRADPGELVALAMEGSDRTHMRAVIEKELLHYDILYALDQERLLEGLTFQGGTALRLCYGAPRLSEDLEFVGGREFDPSRLRELAECLEHYIGDRYGLPVEVRAPRERAARADADVPSNGGRVAKWRISVVTAPRRRELPKQRVNVEVASLPAYTRDPTPLRLNYEFLPDGYMDVLVPTERREEIFSDKLVSLVNTPHRIRHRDIWDLRWLAQRGASVDGDQLRRKVVDYRVDRYPERALEMVRRLPEIVRSEGFIDEMRRFTPAEVQQRTLDRKDFLAFLAREVASALELAAHSLRAGSSDTESPV